MTDLHPTIEEVFARQMEIARNRVCARFGYTEREAQEAERAFLAKINVKRAPTRKRDSEERRHALSNEIPA